MQDYRLVQLEELQRKIDETNSLLQEDPSMAELVKEELEALTVQKEAIEESLKHSQQQQSSDDLDTRNVILEVKGAAGGDEANIFCRRTHPHVHALC